MKKAFTLGVVLMTIVWSMGISVFVPVASAATLAAGDLIKASGPAVYYYAADGKRYTFPTESTYKTWYSDWSGIKTITDDELAAIDLAGNVVVRAGTNLIKIATISKVFAVAPKGKLSWVKTEAAATTLYGANWSKKVIVIPDGFWTNYTNTGAELDGTKYPEGQLVKFAGGSDVYYVNASGTKSKVSTETAFTANKWSWANVVTAPAAITMADGTAIAAAGADYVDVSQGGGAVVTPVVTGTGTLTVALVSDTPVAGVVATGANGNFTKFSLSASGADVSVSKILVTKGGYSGTGDVENIKVTDLGGVSLGSTGSLNSNGTASITFNPALKILAGSSTSYFIRSGVVSGASSGVTASFAIAASADITSTAATVSGSFPVQGNAMSVVAVTVGTVKIYNEGGLTDSQPDSGAKGVAFMAFRVDAGTTEAITIESLSIVESGTASLTDTGNIELWSVTQNKSLGVVASWDATGKASWSGLNIVIGKGENYRFRVKADIISGAGLILNGDLTDGTSATSDVYIIAKGNSYGFYITATDPAAWGGKGTNQTIRSGSLTVSKSASTPATGNIAEATDQVLTTWDFEAKGEPVKVSSTKVTFTLTGSADGADLINCKIYDQAGALVAGPSDSTDATDYITFSDIYIVPVGTTKYTIKCRIFDSDANDWAATTSSFLAGIADPSTEITAKGYNTNDSVVPAPASAVNGNVQTLRVATLAATTLGEPAAKNIAANVSDYVFATFSLNAANSGEDINVTGLSVLQSGTADYSDLKNVEIWCDLATGSSARGDVYETKVSNSEQPTSTTIAFSLAQTIVVKKNTYTKCVVVADASGSANNETFILSLKTGSATVLAAGAATGTSANDTPAGTAKTMTVKTAGGTLTTTVDSSSPKASLIVGGATKQTLAVYRLKADAVESMDLDSVLLGDTGTGAGIAVDTFEVYSSARADGVAITTPIASQVGAAAPAFAVADGTVTVPANGYVLLTVKADLNLVDGSTVTNGLTAIATMADGDGDGTAGVDGDEGVVCTGLSSGANIFGTTGVLTPTTATIYKAKPVVTVDSSSPSGTLGTGSATLVAVFKIDNSDGLDDLTFGTSNSIKVMFNSNATGADAGTEVTTFKDKNGNVLEAVTADIDANAAAKTVILAFATNTLTITAGGYELVKVYADTTGFTAAGNSLQVWMDDGTANSMMWGIANSGTFDTSAVTLRGDLYANALSK